MPCASCDRSALGIFEGIPLTLVCTACASVAVTDEGHAIECLSKAKDLFPSIPPKRVKLLNSSPRRNPHYRNAAPMRMYSFAELQIVQHSVAQDLAEKTKAGES